MEIDRVIHEFTFYWRIENFRLFKGSFNRELLSPVFKVLDNSTWHLALDHCCGFPLSLYLYKNTDEYKLYVDQGTKIVNVRMSILSTNGWIERANFSYPFTTDNRNVDDQSAVILNWNERYSRSRYLPNDCLTLSCHINTGFRIFAPKQCLLISQMFDEEINHSPVLKFNTLKPSNVINFPFFRISQQCPTCESKKQKTKWTQTEKSETDNFSNSSESLQKFSKGKDFDYVTLQTADKSFSVYKAVLCTKSPVFNAMFQGTTKENISSVVDIDDISSKTLALLLQFLHLKPFKDLKWEDAAKLFYAADKYQIEELKIKCLSIIEKKLSNKVICEAVLLADKHQDKNLQKTTEEFFCKNSKTVLHSSEWKDLLSTRTDLASKLLSKLVDHLTTH